LYREILELDPNWQDLHIHDEYGNLLLDEEKCVEAERVFRNATLVFPHHVEFYVRLGISLFGQNRLEEAKVFYRKAHDLDPTNEVVKRIVELKMHL